MNRADLLVHCHRKPALSFLLLYAVPPVGRQVESVSLLQVHSHVSHAGRDISALYPRHIMSRGLIEQRLQAIFPADECGRPVEAFWCQWSKVKAQEPTLNP